MDAERSVCAQLIALPEYNLVIPNTCIAEILNQAPPSNNGLSPDWLLGKVAWRGLLIPVISFISLASQETTAKVKIESGARTLVMKGITENDRLSFYGIAILGIPRQITLDASLIHTIVHPDQNPSLCLQQIMIGKQQAMIPDLPMIEESMSENGIDTGADNSPP